MHVNIKHLFLKILFFIILPICYSCKITENKTQYNFITTLQLSVFKSDTIQLFYKLNLDDSYEESLSIKKAITGSPTSQTLRFELPEGIKPKNIRIDLGERNIHDSMKINSISFQVRNLRLVGDNYFYRNWFNENENLIFDSLKHTYYFKNTKTGFDPQLNGNETLNKRIVKLFPPDINDTH